MSSASSSNPPSSVLAPSRIETPPTPYDVFLSFRGPDTRYKFTGHLYAALDRHGIRTFKDDHELRTGEVISETLIKAIKESKTYVVVFSENYASSPWCLDELVEIYDCHQKMDRLVIGVYYNIEPWVVRHQERSFGKAFEDHEIRYANQMEKVNKWRFTHWISFGKAFEDHKIRYANQREKLNKWRFTLNKVAGLSGQHVSAGRDEADIIDDIVDRILSEIKSNTLYVAKYPVGLDSQVEDIVASLSTVTVTSVTKIGIYGMGGLGKTTLAKALYNQLLAHNFKGNCFLENVRTTSERENGLVFLQQQLIDAVLKSKKKVEVHNVDEGIISIRDRICSRKVLVLIDDIDDFKQYESLVGPFASGSVVIVTTRDQEILDKIEVESKYRCKVNGLNAAEALELFTRHAFGNAKPNSSCLEMSKDILRYADGNPLALVVSGSTLLNQSEERWRWFIDELKLQPIENVEKNLMISFHALKSVHQTLQDIFLDIACFFISWKREAVVKIMETCYTFGSLNIDILEKRCLLTINDDDELGMHDMLRDMGRRIAQNNFRNEPEKYSRLWVSEDIFHVFEKQKGTGVIEGIIPRTFYDHEALEGATFVAATFKMMSKLRFLSLKNVNIRGSFEQTFENLRWLRWECCALEFLPSDFFPQKLVTLELPHSKMRTIWDLNTDSQVFEMLKTLDMSYSLDLIVTPDFTKLSHLETLNLKGCKSLRELHISIGCLASLVSLNLGGCVNLRSLPDNISNLSALRSLNIDGCRTLIGSLTEVNMWGLTVWKLPISVGHLSKLVELNPSYNKVSVDIPSPGAPNSTYVTLTRWDVFLSFRGIDPQDTFIDHLYQALKASSISVYIDNPEVRSTEVISHMLPRAIEESKIFVVVLSEDYAYSDRCLDELVEILRCNNTTGRSIIPVYYNIDPSVLIHQTGSVREAFERHEIRFAGEMNKVNKWRLTLTEFADFSGYFFRNRDELDTIQSIVEDVKANVTNVLYQLGYLVGIDSAVEDIYQTLRMGSNDVRAIGICGMGGIGKTTIAKAFYNKFCNKFEIVCFINFINVTPLLDLLEQMLSQILRRKAYRVTNVQTGIRRLTQILSSKKYLIVLDDLCERSHSELLVRLCNIFSAGSRIIITTRDVNLLNQLKVDISEVDIYMVKVLGQRESLELFSYHAFRKAMPPERFRELSMSFVTYAGGLPVALHVLGSYLRGRTDVSLWKAKLEKVRVIPDRTIQNTLQRSYDGLGDEILKAIFLNIACFFIGKDKDKAVPVFTSCGFYPEANIPILVERGLLTIDKYNKFQMHNLIQVMGRELARSRPHLLLQGKEWKDLQNLQV